MYHLGLFVLLLSQIAFSQVELINTIFLDSSTYLPAGTPVVNYCANDTLNACPNNKDCVDGLNPVYGYTCKKADMSLLQVDYVSNMIYDQLNTVLTQGSNPLVAIEDIIIDQANVKLIYMYSSTLPFGPLAGFIKSAAETAIASNFKSLVGVQMGQGRVVVTPSSTAATLMIEFYFPALTTIVSWESSASGDTGKLENILLTDAGFNASSLYAKMRLLTGYANGTVAAKWLEDISLPPLTDTTYSGLACTSYGRLLNGSLDITPSSFVISQNSLYISDSSCQYIPPSNPNTPPPPGSSSSTSVVVFWGIGLFSLLLSFLYN